MTLPLFKHTFKRSVGLLTHLTSIPSDFGIGTVGVPAYYFINFLKICGFDYWQICPVGPTGFGDSPYQSFSAFAGSPYFIDFHQLVDLGLLEKSSLEPLQRLPANHTDYGSLYILHRHIQHEISEKFTSSHPLYSQYEHFLKSQAHWLLPYATFRALKENFDGQPWWTWGKEYNTFSAAQKTPLCKDLSSLIKKHQVAQFFFFHQWRNLRAHAKANNIKLIGDISIFVALDSADVWSNSELFDLDKNKNPKHLAGVPPDYFSPLGQFWGNPLYRWKSAKQECFQWWMDRLKHNFDLFDVVRLDHFRGFESFWQILANAKDARTGKWIKGPGLAFFKQIKKEIPNAEFIAEDLGIITDEVRQLINDSGLTKMAVLQFAFDNNPQNIFLPHHLEKNCVLYSGTHDNDTTCGWYNHLEEPLKHQIRRYFRISGTDIAWDFIRAAYASPCNLAIVTLQDLLNKDSSARINTPGTSQGNWQWRSTTDELEFLIQNASSSLRELKWLYDR